MAKVVGHNAHMAEKTLEPSLKRTDPEAWEEVLRVCKIIASVGHPPAVAVRHLRHLGVTHPTLINWVESGLIPGYPLRSRTPDLSHLL